MSTMQRFLSSAVLAAVACAANAQAGRADEPVYTGPVSGQVIHEGPVSGGVVHEGVVSGDVSHEGVVYEGGAYGQPNMTWGRKFHNRYPNAYLIGRRDGLWGAPNDPNHGYTWHGNYYNTAMGAPVALVVPPTAFYQTHYTWGMPSSHTTLIPDQFHRANVAGYGGAGTQGPMLPTPYYPSSTDQFGTYYVRGPWW